MRFTFEMTGRSLCMLLRLPVFTYTAAIGEPTATFALCPIPRVIIDQRVGRLALYTSEW